MSKRIARQRAEKGGAKAGYWPLAWRAQHEDTALADAKGRPIAILLTGGEAHDYPIAKRLIRRVKPPKHMLGDTAYDGDVLAKKTADVNDRVARALADSV